MPLDLLSSIKGASSSEAVNQLFNVIKNAVPGKNEEKLVNKEIAAVSIDELREDTIYNCTENEKDLIRKNFPLEKNGFLLVPRVID